MVSEIPIRKGQYVRDFGRDSRRIGVRLIKRFTLQVYIPIEAMNWAPSVWGPDCMQFKSVMPRHSGNAVEADQLAG